MDGNSGINLPSQAFREIKERVTKVLFSNPFKVLLPKVSVEGNLIAPFSKRTQSNNVI